MKCTKPSMTTKAAQMVAPVNRILNGVGLRSEKGSLISETTDGISRGKEKNAMKAQRYRS